MKKNIEHIRTQSGAWYYLSENDIEHFVRDAKKIFQKQINSNSIVGLFIDLDNANLNSMIIYRACNLCGATIIRCGISDLDRQLQVMKDVFLDVLICTDASYKYICDKVNHSKVIIVDSITKYNKQPSYQETMYIYEYFDIPGFALIQSGEIYSPGYDVVEEEGEIILNSSIYIEEFNISNYILTTQCQENALKKELKNDFAHTFIMIQSRIILGELLDGKIDNSGNITLNSIGMVELLILIEEKFDIIIELDKIKKNSFDNLKFLADLVYNALKESENNGV